MASASEGKGAGWWLSLAKRRLGRFSQPIFRLLVSDQQLAAYHTWQLAALVDCIVHNFRACLRNVEITLFLLITAQSGQRVLYRRICVERYLAVGLIFLKIAW